MLERHPAPAAEPARADLHDLLRDRIRRTGPLSFRDFMELALYHPRHGYYANLRGFGADGDFITSPEAHPAFGGLLAKQVEDTWRALGRPRPLRILEVGAGSGALAAALLAALTVPEIEYIIDEPSPALRALQRARLAGRPVRWDHGTAHVVLANEVADALPVHRVRVREGRLRELRVGLDANGAFAWDEAEGVAPEVEAYFERLKLLPPEGATAEVSTGLAAWVHGLSERLERGLLLVLDYGYPAETLFSRPYGTLLTYFQHTLGSDPLVRPGRQDISVHVDFSTLARAAQTSGLDVVGVCSQRTLLQRLGWEQELAAARSPAERRTLVSLIAPDGLGRIGALFATRGLPDYVPLGLTA